MAEEEGPGFEAIEGLKAVFADGKLDDTEAAGSLEEGVRGNVIFTECVEWTGTEGDGGGGKKVFKLSQGDKRPDPIPLAEEGPLIPAEGGPPWREKALLLMDN